MTNSSGISITTQEVIDFLRRDLHLREIYQEIISQKIIDQAAEEEGLEVTPEEIQAELDRISYEYRLDHPSQLLAWVKNEMTTLRDVEKRIYEKILAKKLAQHLFAEQIRERFSQNRGEFEQILLYKILVPYESLAREIFYQIEEEEISFFEAAHIYDMDETRRLQCGYDGKYQRWQLPPELSALLQPSKTGEVIGPIRLAEDRFMLLLMDELFAPELTPEISENLLNQMFQEWMEVKLAVYFNLLQGE